MIAEIIRQTTWKVDWFKQTNNENQTEKLSKLRMWPLRHTSREAVTKCKSASSPWMTFLDIQRRDGQGHGGVTWCPLSWVDWTNNVHRAICAPWYYILGIFWYVLAEKFVKFTKI